MYPHLWFLGTFPLDCPAPHFLLAVLCSFSLRVSRLNRNVWVCSFSAFCISHPSGTALLWPYTSELIFSQHLLSPVLDQGDRGIRAQGPFFRRRAWWAPDYWILNYPGWLPYIISATVCRTSGIPELNSFVIVTVVSSDSKPLLKPQQLETLKWWCLPECVSR